jgi:hypothetical protein
VRRDVLTAYKSSSVKNVDFSDREMRAAPGRMG